MKSVVSYYISTNNKDSNNKKLKTNKLILEKVVKSDFVGRWHKDVWNGE